MPRIKGTPSQEILHTLLTAGAFVLAAQSLYCWVDVYERWFQGKSLGLREPQVRDAFRYLRKKRLIYVEKHKELKTAIERAMRLGNAYKGKVKIVFEDNEGLKAVETTIWGVTDKNILLKQTTLIPIRRVHEIRFN